MQLVPHAKWNGPSVPDRDKRKFSQDGTDWYHVQNLLVWPAEYTLYSAENMHNCPMRSNYAYYAVYVNYANNDITHITQFMSITQIIDIPSIITHIPRVMVKIKSIKRIKSNYAVSTRVPHCAVPGCSGIIYNILHILLIMRGMSKMLRNWRKN